MSLEIGEAEKLHFSLVLHKRCLHSTTVEVGQFMIFKLLLCTFIALQIDFFLFTTSHWEIIRLNSEWIPNVLQTVCSQCFCPQIKISGKCSKFDQEISNIAFRLLKEAIEMIHDFKNI